MRPFRVGRERKKRSVLDRLDVIGEDSRIGYSADGATDEVLIRCVCGVVSSHSSAVEAQKLRREAGFVIGCRHGQWGGTLVKRD